MEESSKKNSGFQDSESTEIDANAASQSLDTNASDAKKLVETEETEADQSADEERPGKDQPADVNELSDPPSENQAKPQLNVPVPETEASASSVINNDTNLADKAPSKAERKSKHRKIVAIVAAAIFAVFIICAAIYSNMPRALELDQTATMTSGISISYPSDWELSSDSEPITIGDDSAKIYCKYYVSYGLPSDGGTDEERHDLFTSLIDSYDADFSDEESLQISGFPAYKANYVTTSSDTGEATQGALLAIFTGNNLNLVATSHPKDNAETVESLTLSSALDSVIMSAEKLTVTFDDGQGNKSDETCWATDLAGCLIAPDSFKKDGYILSGWTCADSNVTITYDSSNGYVIDGLTEDTTLEATWDKGCTVTFEDGSGNVLSKQTVAQGSSATAPTNPTKTGCTFAGWDKDFSNVDGDMTVTATWGYGSGSYRVGKDIPAGEYKLKASSSSYYCVYPDLTKSDILENGNFTTVAYITLSEGQLFELNRGSCVPIEGASATETLTGDGIYKVGLDLPAGQYKLTQDSSGTSAYYAVLSTVDATTRHNIVDNDNFENVSYIEVRDGQYLELSRCTATPAD